MGVYDSIPYPGMVYNRGSDIDRKTWKKCESIFQSGKSLGILNSQGNSHNILEKSYNFTFSWTWILDNF